VIVLGDDISTDDIIPASRCTSFDEQHLGKYALEYLVKRDLLPGDGIIDAGRNFGCGSSREHAPLALKGAGICEVRALSFADIFYRNAINIGLKIVEKENRSVDFLLADIISAGGLVRYNLRRRSGSISVPKSCTPHRSMTITEKILARTSFNDYVTPGEIVFAVPDLTMSHDAVVAPIESEFKNNFGVNQAVVNPEKIILVADHFIQVNDIRHDPQAINLYTRMVAFAKEQGLRILDKVSENEAMGICHVLLPELGYVKPGMFIVGTDSHTCTYGALGAFSMGIGTTDASNIFALGDLWLKVPETVKVVLEGRLRTGVFAKDLALSLVRDLGPLIVGKVLEFSGSGSSDLSIEDRMTVANMAIEMGAYCGLFPVDEKTLEYLKQIGITDFERITADPNAEYFSKQSYDLNSVSATVSMPFTPGNSRKIEDLRGIKINVGYIGSCTGGKLEDLASAATAVSGKHVAPSVSLYIVPATQRVKREAERLGYLQVLREAGAIILPSGCGACINAGKGVLQKGEVGIFATNRNFKGRNGHPDSLVYLASPYVVGLSAVKGFISDT
jgi:methanogen homoaconitase large subunit/3-benzylmalate isomerase